MTIDFCRRAAAGDFSPDVLTWLRHGMARHFNGDPLDEALGVDRASRVRTRNRALLDASAQLGGATTWQRAGRLAAAIKRFEARILPMLKADSEHPLSDVDKALARAFATGERITRTQRKLNDLLA